MTLNEAIINKKYLINHINASGLMKERLLSFGFIPGNIVMVVNKRKQIAIYEISKSMIALREYESVLITVDDDG